MENRIKIGELVQSVSGHDADGFFLVIREEGSFVWLCDGRNRKADCLKKKNKKHIAGSGVVCSWVSENPEKVNNTSVRKAIKEIIKETGGENVCQRKTF